MGKDGCENSGSFFISCDGPDEGSTQVPFKKDEVALEVSHTLALCEQKGIGVSQTHFRALRGERTDQLTASLKNEGSHNRPTLGACPVVLHIESDEGREVAMENSPKAAKDSETASNGRVSN